MTAWQWACKAAERQARTFVSWDHFWRNEWPIKPDEHCLYFNGQRSVTDACCHRQLCAEELRPYPTLAVIGPYIAELEEKHRGAHAPLGREWLLERRPPLFFDRPVQSGSGETLVYVDVEAAYWSLYTRTTLDVDYDGEGTIRRGVVAFEDADELRKDKLVRNALLGMLRRTRRRGVDHGDYFVEEVPAHKRRPCLWALVMDTLEVVMLTARDLGAVYVHTDGAIFTHPDLAAEWIARCADFGLVASERCRGDGYVMGLGYFRIGDEVHPKGRVRPMQPGSPVDNMLAAPAHITDALTEWLVGTRMPGHGFYQENQGGSTDD